MKNFSPFEITIDKEIMHGNFRIFWIAFFFVFIAVILQHLGIRIPPFFTLAQFHTLSQKTSDIFPQVLIRLQTKPNDFKLKHSTIFTQQSLAAKPPNQTAADYQIGITSPKNP